MTNESTVVNRLAQWQPDESIDSCLHCQVKFNFLTRRHHCRCCGGIFCGNCTDRFCYYETTGKVRIIQRSSKDTNKKELPPYRTCIPCYCFLSQEGLLLNRTIRLRLQPDSQSISNTHTDANAATNSHVTTDEALNNMIQEVSKSDSETEESHELLTADRTPELSNTNSNSSSGTSTCSGSSDNNTSISVSYSASIATPAITTDVRQVLNTQSRNDQDSAFCPVCNIDLSQLSDDTKIEQHIQRCIENAEAIQQHKKVSLNAELLLSEVALKRMLVFKMPPSTTNENSSTGCDFDQNECPICFEEMEPGTKVGRLECFCVFHYDCIKAWFNKKAKKIYAANTSQTTTGESNHIGKNLCPLHDAIF
ncbi:hypothetical protein TBLA_0C03510 [Henningerozyma blattae CBS 6284]|uniref:RING-type E3 ubiquitin transferase n=1 Tax=Henningerozyma blattae (strain ATCC 34711 / CBS 6284 / DSM 70876 / NBRC 10599 / NRRL Y-10934 / UCD 77-7) TaxID=1071380 RepID=I2H1A1_HENB6|nr:hypothetical protein TBLA_0C03510 [Tetrapisispora blattae CBS 6284]CCH60153.1 hypothetical protein TBLA_0C03510 [Tetrapisispora blattae CBS 6284]